MSAAVAESTLQLLGERCYPRGFLRLLLQCVASRPVPEGLTAGQESTVDHVPFPCVDELGNHPGNVVGLLPVGADFDGVAAQLCRFTA